MPGDIATAWAEYEHRFVPADTAAGERERLRKAFYAGIGSLIELLGTVFSPDGEPTEAELSRIDGIEQELLQYAEVAKAGRA